MLLPPIALAGAILIWVHFPPRHSAICQGCENMLKAAGGFGKAAGALPGLYEKVSSGRRLERWVLQRCGDVYFGWPSKSKPVLRLVYVALNIRSQHALTARKGVREMLIYHVRCLASSHRLGRANGW